MPKVRATKPSRRDIVRLAAATAVGPFVAFPDRTLARQQTLKIAKWAHFLPEYDEWFAGVLAEEWGRQHDTNVVVDHIPVESIHTVAAAEIAAGGGHDTCLFPSLPAEFWADSSAAADSYETGSFRRPVLDRFAHRSTF